MNRDAQYHHRMNRAINFAEDHCGGDIDLHAMADAACLSKYHFLRQFKIHVGETPVRFLQRIRLERALRKLVFLRQTPITEIALDSGFSSLQSFSSAFQARYGNSAQQFRKSNNFRFKTQEQNRNLGEVYPSQSWLDSRIVQKTNKVQIRQRTPSRFAYIRNIGPYLDATGVLKVCEVLKQWARRQGINTVNLKFICIPWDNPNVTPPAHCRYDICIPIADHTQGDDLVAIQTIPGGTYAVMPLTQKSMQTRYAWEVFTKSWLPKSNYLIDFRAGFEVVTPSKNAYSYHCSSLWLAVHRQ